MRYLHVKKIADYHPSYTDREHKWAKIHFKSFLNEEFQALDEIDRYRFWSLIVFEVKHQKPIALTPANLNLLGWNSRKRSISKTIQMLHTLIEVCDGEDEKPVSQSRVEESRVEESRKKFVPPTLEEVQQYIKDNPKLSNIDPQDFFDGYNDGGWIDTFGNPVRNWKLKLRTRSNYGRTKKTERGAQRPKTERHSFAEQESDIGETVE